MWLGRWNQDGRLKILGVESFLTIAEYGDRVGATVVPLIVCHLTLAERLRFLPPGWVAASSPAQKGIDDPTIQMFFRVPEKLCLD